MATSNKTHEITVTPKQINIDFNSLREVAYLGVRRAAAFLGIGLETTEDYVPTTFSIAKHSMWRSFLSRCRRRPEKKRWENFGFGWLATPFENWIYISASFSTK